MKSKIKPQTIMQLLMNSLEIAIKNSNLYEEQDTDYDLWNSEHNVYTNISINNVLHNTYMNLPIFPEK
jgi:hypothetical protein